MTLSTAFNDYQELVDADPEHVREARARRDTFIGAFRKVPSCTERRPSGSLARGTQRDPIHDVDLIMVFDPNQHPDWDGGSGTAHDALEETRGFITDLLGQNRGSHDKVVRLAMLRNHVVKCFLDDPDDPDAFAVEVMPALRVSGGLRVPEQHNDRWITVNPEHLKTEIAKRHAQWRNFAKMVRVIKAWKDYRGLDMKSLVAEVLVLENMPRPPASGVLTRQEALRGFFTAAAVAVMNGVDDPAKLCGEIQPDLDREAVRAALLESADLATRAIAAEDRKDYDHATCTWRQVLGSDFPEPEGGCGGGSKAGLIGAPAFIPSRVKVKEAPQG